MRTASFALTGGIGVTVIGLYLAGATWLLLEASRCEGGLACGDVSNLISEFWGGIVLVCVGLASTTLASLQLVKKLLRK